jgi:hypothetical protein
VTEKTEHRHADLDRAPKPADAPVIAARLGRRIQQHDAWDAESAARVLLPHVAATIESEQRLADEVRRWREATEYDTPEECRAGLELRERELLRLRTLIGRLAPQMDLEYEEGPHRSRARKESIVRELIAEAEAISSRRTGGNSGGTPKG